MSRADIAYGLLASAMENTEPNCTGSELFTADDLEQPDIAELARICDTCPLFILCDDYARLERPKAGVWAGKRYRNYQPRKEASDVV